MSYAPNPPTGDDQMAMAGWDIETLRTSTGASALAIARCKASHRVRSGRDSIVAEVCSTRVKGHVTANDVAITHALMRAGRIIGGKNQ